MTGEPEKEAIQFEEFMKMDLRVGQILEAKKVKKAKVLIAEASSPLGISLAAVLAVPLP